MNFPEREEIETFTIESLSLKLNWIFYLEVDETSLNFQVNVSEEYEHLDPEKGLQVLARWKNSKLIACMTSKKSSRYN